MRAYALYEHPSFDTSKDHTTSRSALLKATTILTLIIVSGLAMYQYMTTGSTSFGVSVNLQSSFYIN